jgi:hypothetical protein
MIARILLVASGLSLVASLGLFFANCNGTTNFNAAYPLASSTMHIDVTTTGIPALGALGFLILCLLLLVVGLVLALTGFFRHQRALEKLAETQDNVAS